MVGLAPTKNKYQSILEYSDDSEDSDREDDAVSLTTDNSYTKKKGRNNKQ